MPRQNKEYFAAYREKNRERVRLKQREWYLKNKDRAYAASRKYADSGKEKETRNRTFMADPEKHRRRALERAYKCKTKDINRYRLNQRNYQSRRRCLGGYLVPRECILEVYKNCPDTLEVDHIIPLQHPDICGLHVPWNMQYLNRSQNAIKNDNFDFTYENAGWKTKLKAA